MGRGSPSAPMSVDGDSLQLGQNFTKLVSWSPTVVAAEIVDISGYPIVIPGSTVPSLRIFGKLENRVKRAQP